MSKIRKGYIVKCLPHVRKAPKGWALCDGKDGTPDLRKKPDPYIIKV